MVDRRITLLTDDEVSMLLTGLRLLSSKCISEGNKDLMFLSDKLYDTVENSYEVGVIFEKK